MDLQEAFAPLGRHHLFYRLAGKGREALLLLHGIPTNSLLWGQTIPYLAENYLVIAPDLLGYGRSGRGPTEDLTLPQQAGYMIGLLDRLGIPRVHVVGHDLGGGIAQILAVRHPDRVASFVVADGVCFSNWPLPKVVSLRYPTAPEFEPSPAFIERMLRVGLFHQELATPELIDAFVAPYAHATGAQELQTASFALEHHQTEELVPHLANVQAPATFLWGQYDRYLPPYWGYRLNQTVPNSTFRILPECGHYSMIDNPPLFAQELLQHLQRIL
ncbi:alpha/beta fold hydrolase [Heliobacterium undosum]|uniref:Alpha/beta fold hydrolase n=1 Tax=Heliomicrobium undosum TaxID=121734 RepID=A0A845L0G2_9FIRM|nr:alpha/beta hydrolase [Heliomicrobium undosum]MZP29982.1 alpha/beta fold hydrolase [Heliomicrobium undosum]